MKLNVKSEIDEYISKDLVFDIHLLRLIREIIFISQPLIHERIRMGIALYEYDKKVICALISQKDYFLLKFPFGSRLKDTKRILLGNHKYHKFLKIYTRNDIDPFVIYDFIKQSKGMV